MTTTPPPAPADPGHDAGGPGPGQPGQQPGQGRDELRELARLRRSRHDRKVAGVAGGLARHFDIDPIIPRVLLAVLVFFGGAGLLLYGVLWLVVPQEQTEDATVRLDDRSRVVVIAVVTALAGLAVLGDTVSGWDLPWPLGLIGLVVLVVLLARGQEPRLHPLLRPGTVPPPPASAYPPAAYPPAAYPSATTPYPTAPPPSGTGTYAAVPVRPRRRGPILFWYALALIAVGCGVLGMVDLAGVDVLGSAYPALALGVSAVMLLLGAFWGRAGGIIALGLLATVVTAAGLVVDEMDAGQIDVTPTTAAAVQDRYDLTIGEIRLDLSEVVDPENLDGRTVEVEVDFAGHIDIVVPDDVDVVVDSRLDEGEHRVFGDNLPDGNTTTTSSADGGVDAPELRLDVAMAFGEIEIHREGDRR